MDWVTGLPSQRRIAFLLHVRKKFFRQLKWFQYLLNFCLLIKRAKCKHRRHTVDFDYPGNYCHVGNLHLLNHIGPDSDHPSLHKPEFKQHQTDEAMKGTSHEKHQPANKKSTSSLNIAVHRPTAVAELHGNQHLGYQIPEKERCELDKKKDGKPENLEITIKISRKRPQPAKTGNIL